MFSSTPVLLLVKEEEEDTTDTCSNSSTTTPAMAMEENSPQRHKRRAIANSNERRRMESINAGYSTLLNLLPHSYQQERMSKAAILQSSAEHILQLQRDNADLRAQNSDMERKLLKLKHGRILEDEMGPAAKKPKANLVGSGEGTPTPSQAKEEIEGSARDNLMKEILHLRFQLDIERRQRLEMEKFMSSEYSTFEQPKDITQEIENASDEAEAPAVPTAPEKKATETPGSLPTSPEDNIFLIMEAINLVEGKELFKNEPEEDEDEDGRVMDNSSGAVKEEVEGEGKKRLDLDPTDYLY